MRSMSRKGILESLEDRRVLDSTVVFNELMYHPADDAAAEWIELHNQMAVDMDVSHWRIEGGIEFQFPENSTVQGGGYVVIAHDPNEVPVDADRLFGPFVGRISNGGEELRLLNRSGRIMDALEYSDTGDWPVAPDGSGATLAKGNSQAGSAIAKNWTSSLIVGGTPGTANFASDTDDPVRSNLVRADATWRYDASNVAPDPSWNTPAFNDADWESGQAILFAGQFENIESPSEIVTDLPSSSISIKNPSFESNAHSGVGYGDIDDWNVVGGTGINPAIGGGAPFIDNGAIPDGDQAAFIQGQGSISQRLSGFDRSVNYVLQLHYNARACCGGTPAIAVNFAGRELVSATDVEPVGANNDFHTISVPFRPHVSAGTLTINNVGRDGDHSILIDGISVSPITSDEIPIINSSFEASGTPSNENRTENIAGWHTDGSGVAGVIDSTNPLHVNGVIPDGQNTLFIEGLAAAEQTVSGLTSGNRYAISYGYNASAERPAPAIAVSIDRSVIAHHDVTPVSAEDNYHQSVATFIATDESATIRFEQLNAGADSPVVFLDVVRLFETDSPLASELPIGASTYYFRTEVDYHGDPARTELNLKSFVDDGAAVYLNGVEIWRDNLAAGEVSHTTRATSAIGDPEFSEEIPVSSTSLLRGTNVIAVEVHQAAANDPDMAFALELNATEFPARRDSTISGLLINEIGGSTGAFDVELINEGNESLALSDYQLQIAGRDANLPDIEIAPGQIVSTGASVVGIDTGDTIFLKQPTSGLIVDAIDIGRLGKARSLEDALWFNVAENTFGQPNQLAVNDSIVINEIMYHDQPTYFVDPVVQHEELILIDDAWRYRDDNVPLPPNWKNVEFSDADWPIGNAILHGGTTAIDLSGDLPPGLDVTGIDVRNPSFELGALPRTPGYGSIDGWINSGNTGVNDRLGPFTNRMIIPDGLRIAFIHGQDAISQSLTGFVPGKKYTLQYWENERGEPDNVAQTFAMIDDQTVVAAHDVERMDRFRRIISEPFTATAATHTIALGNSRPNEGPESDTAALFDAVQVTRAVPLITNGNFESFVLPESSSQEAPNGEEQIGWHFEGASGISRNRSPLQGSQRSHDGNQIGYLRGVSSISQAVSGFETGVVYSLSWSERMWRDSPTANDLEVVLDAGLPTEQIISSKRLVADTDYAEITSENFTAAKEDYTVTFRSSMPNGGATDTYFLDDIRFNFENEPRDLGTEIQVAATTHYYRTEFDLNHNPAHTELSFQLLLDDGAVVYLNGTEVYRENMPAGPFDHATPGSVDQPLSQFRSISITGEPIRSGRNVIAVETHQAIDSNDAIFGGYLSATITDPGSVFSESTEEWIELFNRGTERADISGWKLSDAVSFQFPPETTIEPNEFLVVAKNPASLSQKYPNVDIVGGFSGQLSNRGETIRLLDDLENIADMVEYFDGRNWPDAADGGGATLELIDPWADNNRGEAWAASDESDQSEWQTYSYRAVASEPDNLNTPSVFDEFILGLLDSGEILLDDIQVIEDPDHDAIDRMQNGSFESDIIGREPRSWRIVGNHHGTVITDPDNDANKVLRLTANGPTEHMSNHAEVTFADGADIADGKEYEISYRAKWLSGSPQVNTRLYFSRAAETIIVDRNDRFGTPGLPNDNGPRNIGPTFSQLRHDPIVPDPGEPVTISISAFDPQGVSELALYYSVDGAAFTQLPMTASGDSFRATIPAQERGDIVQFYVSGTDLDGATSLFPPGGEASRALYRVSNGDLNSDVHTLRIIMTDDDQTFLHTNSNVMSNDRLGATVIYNDIEVFYDVGVRLRASGYGRQGSLAGFNIQFNPDQLFRGVHRTIAIDRGSVFSNGDGTGGVRGVPGASAHELLTYLIAHHAGGIAGMYDDVISLEAPRPGNSGLGLLKMARYSDVFLDSQFEAGSEGLLYKFELIYHATTTTNGHPESLKRGPNAVIGTDITDLGSDKDAYRHNFILKNNRARDDYDSLIELGQAFALRGNELDQASQEIMDVDQWMRNFALLSLVGVADVYNMGLAHNLELYVRPTDGKVLAFPWDVDHGFFYSPTASILGRGGSNLHKVINLPHNRRLFHKHLLDIVQTTYNTDFLASWAKHYSDVTGSDLEQFYNDYISTRADYVLSRLAPEIPFEITTNDGNPMTVDDTVVSLRGTGWIDVHRISAGTQGELDVRWLDDERWILDVPISAGENQITLTAFDYQGRAVGSDSIVVTSTISDRPLQDFLRVVEIMYHAADPTASEASINPAWTDNDFEFLELMNISTDQTLDLTEVTITHGPSQPFSFADASITTLLPNERVVVVGNLAAFAARYGEGLPVAGQFTGNLSNGGEQIRVEDGDGAVIVDFLYADQRPWPIAADGNGPSLELIDPLSTPVNEFGQANRWKASDILNGTPGSSSRLIGDFTLDGILSAEDIDAFCNNDGSPKFDLNLDGAVNELDFTHLIENIFNTSAGDADLNGVFDSSDLVLIFRAGEYEDDVAGNSTWSSGDWNCDGDFNTSDLVAAFRTGRYEAGR